MFIIMYNSAIMKAQLNLINLDNLSIMCKGTSDSPEFIKYYYLSVMNLIVIVYLIYKLIAVSLEFITFLYISNYNSCCYNLN